MLEALRARDARIREQQKELLHSERLAAIGQLSAEIVHEIRNPLNSISLNIDWLENELQGSHSEIAATVKSISREIERLAQITESYLIRARVPVPDGERQRTEVHDLLSEILDFSSEEDRARNIAVETRWVGQDLFVKGERSRLKQAFLNVLKNAREAMPRGGRLVVETEVRDNTYRIRFSDNGHGMNESMRGRTFQPFFTTKTNGTGLGLMLTRSIVEEAQGTVQCESELGIGTTFTFQFPA
jgi:signal transduction histidine kinase